MGRARRRRTRLRSATTTRAAMRRAIKIEHERAAIAGETELPVNLDERPKTRADCAEAERPCPWVGCKFHLYLDVNPETGSIKLNFPDLHPWDMEFTCALDVAEMGEMTLEEVGDIMNLTRERIRQVEVRGLIKLKLSSPSPEELGENLLSPNESDEDSAA